MIRLSVYNALVRFVQTCLCYKFPYFAAPLYFIATNLAASISHCHLRLPLFLLFIFSIFMLLLFFTKSVISLPPWHGTACIPPHLHHRFSPPQGRIVGPLLSLFFYFRFFLKSLVCFLDSCVSLTRISSSESIFRLRNLFTHEN